MRRSKQILVDPMVGCMDSSLAVVNHEACLRVAKQIKEWNVPADYEDIALDDLSCKEIGNFFLLLVSICHQTSPTGKLLLEGIVNGKYRRGWDYLASRLEVDVRQDRLLLRPESWSQVTPKKVTELFRDSQYGDRLVNVERRSELVRDLGKVMKEHGWNSADDIYKVAHGRVAGESPNLFELLGRFKAYSDPVRKKSSFFLSLMRNSGLWQYPDESNLGPPVDYHEVRGHLRIGTVCVASLELRNKLLHRKVVSLEEDLAVRGAVFNAIMLISRACGPCTPSQLHYLFWNVFRSCCTREKPHCRTCPYDCDLPSQYVPLTFIDHERRCPFSFICTSSSVPVKYYDHVFETDYY